MNFDLEIPKADCTFFFVWLLLFYFIHLVVVFGAVSKVRSVKHVKHIKYYERNIGK